VNLTPANFDEQGGETEGTVDYDMVLYQESPRHDGGRNNEKKDENEGECEATNLLSSTSSSSSSTSSTEIRETNVGKDKKERSSIIIDPYHDTRGSSQESHDDYGDGQSPGSDSSADDGYEQGEDSNNLSFDSDSDSDLA